MCEIHANTSLSAIVANTVFCLCALAGPCRIGLVQRGSGQDHGIKRAGAAASGGRGSTAEIAARDLGVW